MKLVYFNGRFMIEGRDFRWQFGERLLFNFLVARDDVISVVDLGRFKQAHYGKGMGQPVERVLDPAQKMMDGGNDEQGRMRRGGRLPQLRGLEGDGSSDPGDPR